MTTDDTRPRAPVFRPFSVTDTGDEWDGWPGGGATVLVTGVRPRSGRRCGDCVYRSWTTVWQVFPWRGFIQTLDIVVRQPIVPGMRLLILGAGGVGSAAALI